MLFAHRNQSGIARCQTAFRNILRDHRAGADHRTISDRHTLQNNRARSNKDVTPNHDGSGARGVFVLPGFSSFIERVKIIVEDHCTRTDDCPFTDPDTFSGAHHRATQPNTIFQNQFRRRPKSSQNARLKTAERIGTSRAVQADFSAETHLRTATDANDWATFEARTSRKGGTFKPRFHFPEQPGASPHMAEAQAQELAGGECRHRAFLTGKSAKAKRAEEWRL
jgi:hypothetical protein